MLQAYRCKWGLGVAWWSMAALEWSAWWDVGSGSGAAGWWAGGAWGGNLEPEVIEDSVGGG
jgi:hypothetical protein